MKKIILLVLVVFVITGCDNKNSDGSYSTSGSLLLETVVIDSCEYISAYQKLAHKGNCRFCAQRRKQEMKELVEQLKGE